MNRRKAMKAAAGIVAGGGAGLLALIYGFGNADTPAMTQKNVDYQHPENSWKFSPLDPELTAQLAYDSLDGNRQRQ